MCFVRVDRSNQQIISVADLMCHQARLQVLDRCLLIWNFRWRLIQYLQQVAFIIQILWQVFFSLFAVSAPLKIIVFLYFLTDGPYILYRKFRITIAKEKSLYLMRILQSSQNINIENVFHRNSVSIVAIVPSNTTTFERHCQFVSSLKRL